MSKSDDIVVGRATESLKNLAIKGVIASPLLAGMLVCTPASLIPYRVLEVDAHRSTWRPKVLPIWSNKPFCLTEWMFPRVAATDPATVWCWMALLREATGNPFLCTQGRGAVPPSTPPWAIFLGDSNADRWSCAGSSEADVITMALARLSLGEAEDE